MKGKMFAVVGPIHTNLSSLPLQMPRMDSEFPCKVDHVAFMHCLGIVLEKGF